MDGAIIPKEEDPPPHLSQQVPEELDYPTPVEVLVQRADPEIELALELHRRDQGELHSIPLAHLDLGVPSLHPPSPSYIGLRLNEALVQEQERGPRPSGFSLDLRGLDLLQVPDVGIVPHEVSGQGNLCGEVQISKDVPHPGLSEFLPEPLLDDLGHPLQGPEICGIAVREGPLHENLAQAFPLRGVNLSGSNGVLCLPPRPGTLREATLLPCSDGLVGHLHRRAISAFETPRCNQW